MKRRRISIVLATALTAAAFSGCGQGNDIKYELRACDFLDEYEEVPDTANPSLWRNTQLNHLYGLFQVSALSGKGV